MKNGERTCNRRDASTKQGGGGDQRGIKTISGAVLKHLERKKRAAGILREKVKETLRQCGIRQNL